MSGNGHKQDRWAEAKHRCRLSAEEIRIAKELGFKPQALVRNIPSPSQQWKAPVSEWVRSLHERKFGSKPVPSQPASPESKTSGAVIEFRNPDYPWPDRPRIPELVVRPDDADEFEEDEDSEFAFELARYRERFEPPESDEIEEDNIRILRRQRLFRWAAQSIAVAMNGLPEVRKLAAFGSVAQPLEIEVPRFSQYRRHGIRIYHECRDLDLAVWTSDLNNLHGMKKALSRGLSSVQDTPYGGVAHHQVDVHVFDDTDSYRGRLCIFGQCPKGKRECLVEGCGDRPFLPQFERYRFNGPRFSGEPKVILMDKATGFLVRPPHVDAPPDDVPF